MIGVIFEFNGEFVEVRIDNKSVYFRSNNNPYFAKIEGLKLNKEGVEKEFPDLKNDMEWRQKAIKRFNEKVASINTEDGRVNYIITDLRKFGYIPKYIQREGFRPKKIKC
jgi:hypothetical protein